ncbi:hypothetical protein MRX96_037734 [Rhipicephalus microplus]
MTSLTLPNKGRPHHPALLGLVAVLLVPLALGTAGVAAASDPPSTTATSVGTSTGVDYSPATEQTVENIASSLQTTTPGAPLDNETATPTASSAHTTSSAHTSEQTSSPGHQTSTASSETTTGDSITEHTSTVTTTETVTTPAVTHSDEATVTPSMDIDGRQPNATNGTEPTPSVAGTTTTVAPTTLLPTTTKRRVPEVTEEDVVMKSTPTQRRLLLVLRGNCSHDSLKSDVQGAFRNLSSAAENISVTDIRCTTLLDVNVTFKAGELQLKQLLRNLSLAGTLQLGGDDRHFLLTDFSVKGACLHRWSTHSAFPLGADAIRCCRRQPSKTLDFLDTPRLNLRLEDYTLTRIPRPHTVYADHLRTPDQELGVVQAFDTCVVPLEDVMPPPAPTHSKPSPANGLKVARRSATRAEEEDDDESSLRGNGALSTSTERLARRDSGRRQGVDNPIYLVDRRKSKG